MTLESYKGEVRVISFVEVVGFQNEPLVDNLSCSNIALIFLSLCPVYNVTSTGSNSRSLKKPLLIIREA